MFTSQKRDETFKLMKMKKISEKNLKKIHEQMVTKLKSFDFAIQN